MPFQLSPGVAVVEKDFSSIVPAVSSSAGAFAGPFAWGPIEDPVRVSSETDLVSRFGKPTDSNFQSFFTAANFLSYTNNIVINRTDAAGLKNAVAVQSGGVSQAHVQLTDPGAGYEPGTPGEVPTVTFGAPDIDGGVRAEGVVTFTDTTVNNVTTRTITGILVTESGTGYTSAPLVTIQAPLAGTQATARVTSIARAGVKIKNIQTYLDTFNTGSAVVGPWAAKFAGSKGNGIRVVTLDAGNWASASAAIKLQFTGAPGTSTFAAARGITNDEVHIAIFDNAKGEFSGVANSLLEKYSFVSKLSDARRQDGSNNYYKSVINSQSRYVWWMGAPIASALSDTLETAIATEVAAVVAQSTNTITIQDGSAFATLHAFKQFFDAASDTRQIKLTGSQANDTVLTVVSIETTLSNNSVNGYVITVAEDVADEVVTGLSITSVSKPTWGQNSDAVVAAEGASTLAVLGGEYTFTLSGGTDDFASSEGNIQSAYAQFANTDQYDISLIPLGNVSALTAKFVVDNVAEVRKDCVVFISPRNTDGSAITSTGSTATSAIKNFRADTTIDSSYAVMDSGFKYQYDRYNDAYRWVPLNGDVAGLCARTDFNADPWFSPGGFNRGQIKNIVKLGFNPSQADRDELYASGVNPVVTFPGQGTILYGDKTLLSKPSAFDRINVRRLFIVLEKSIAIAAKYQMFEFNDSFTRAQFKNLVEPFLRDVQGRRGVTDFRVKCDESNNTGEVIDRNEFIADIFIKPNRSINYITLNFVAARSSVSFEEIGG